MYVIANIIYGIDLTTDRHEEPIFDELPEELKRAYEDDPENIGISGAYSGSGPTPQWVGVTLGEFDETSNFELEDLRQYLDVGEETVKQWEKRWTNLEQEVREAIVKVKGSEPKVMIIWSTS